MINVQNFSEYQSEFLKYFPDCEDFQLPQYIEHERAYKQELSDIFTGQLTHRIESLPEDASDQLKLADDAIGLFKRRLKSAENKPQNLVGYRYWNFLTHLSDPNRVAFLLELHKLLFGEKSLGDRVDQFVAFLSTVPTHPDWQYSRAAGRSIYSFYLFLADPSQHMFIHTTMMQTALMALTGEGLPEQAGGAGYSQVQKLAQNVKQRLEKDGWQPKDMIDVHSFLWVKTGYKDELPDTENPTNTTSKPESNDNEGTMVPRIQIPLNQILYGPPGTGKTYHTVNRALEILDPNADTSSRTAMKARFDELYQEGRIAQVTFHQSFSYEDFVEGLKATSEDGKISYEVEDGIFKKICLIDQASVEKASSVTVDTTNKTVWKMSLGDAKGADAYIYDHCIEHNEIRLGYGGTFDFSQATSKESISKKFEDEGKEIKDQDYRVTSVNTFRNQMKPGDLVVVSDGNKKFRAIGEIKGDYQCKPDENLDGYGQTRAVTWHRVWDKSLPYDQLLNKSFSQMTLYQLRQKVLKMEKLAELLGDTKVQKKDSGIVAGQLMYEGRYQVVFASDQIVRVRVKKTGSITCFDMEMLKELAGYVNSGKLSTDDIKQKKVYEKTDSNLEKFIVNGYPGVIGSLVELLTCIPPEDVAINQGRQSAKVLIIDEINRGNIAGIFGELITLIEPSKRKGNLEALEVTLPYSKENFAVPNNLYIIGTMNTADRSLALLDTALRRRFEFEAMMPDVKLLEGLVVDGVDISRLLESINHRVELLYDRDHLLGHSFFMGLTSQSTLSDLRHVFERNILPTLEEYFFEDWGRIRQVLGDTNKQSSPQFIVPRFTPAKIEGLLGDGLASEVGTEFYMRNDAALNDPAAYIGIYQPE